MVCSRPRPPVRSAAAIRSSANRYAGRSAATTGSGGRVGAEQGSVVQRAVGARGEPVRPVARTAPLVRVGHQVVAERRRGAEHRDQPAAQPRVGGQRAASSADPVPVSGAATAALRLDQPVQLAQRQVGVGGPGQRGDQLGGDVVDRFLRRSSHSPSPSGRAGRRRGPWSPSAAPKPYRASRPARWSVWSPGSCGRAAAGRAGSAVRPARRAASAANRAANGCQTSSTSAITASQAATTASGS